MKGPPKNKLPENPRIVFMGTPDFAVPGLKGLFENGYPIISVITQPDRKKGRGRKVVPSSVKQAALAYGLEVLQPQRVSSPEFCEKIRKRDPDIFVVIAFGQVLKKNFLDIPNWGSLNIHASLLPKYRGAAPIHCAILNHEKKTGLTAMKMDEGLDTGPILLQKEVAILPDETAGQLHDRLAGISTDFLLKTLEGLIKGRLEGYPQDDSEATYASKIDRGMSRVKWNQSAKTISSFIRALDPWPGAVTTAGDKNIKLYSSRVVDEKNTEGVPGRISGISDGALQVETGKGIVHIRELQAPGKRRLPAEEFIRGFSLQKRMVLG
jgi:methionyl-tRNA formyltransferase